MKINLSVIIIIYFNLNAQAQSAARFAAIAESGIALGGIWSVNANQAGLLDIKHPTLTFNYQKPFSGQPVAAQSADLALPLKQQVWALGFYRYGFEAYREQQIQLAYARSFGPDFTAAMAFHYHQLYLQQYGKSITFSVDAGMQYQMNETLRLGAHISNLGNQSFDNELNYAALPLSVQFGLVYHCTKQTLLSFAFAQSPGSAISPKLGLEYQPSTFLALRGGCKLHPFSGAAGFGLNWKAFKLDLAYTGRQVLGYGTQIGLEYAF